MTKKPTRKQLLAIRDSTYKEEFIAICMNCQHFSGSVTGVRFGACLAVNEINSRTAEQPLGGRA